MSTTTELETLPSQIVTSPTPLHTLEPAQARGSRSPKLASMPPCPPTTTPNPSISNSPPVDRGPAPWKFLFGASTIEAFQWGRERPRRPTSRQRQEQYYRFRPHLRRLPKLILLAPPLRRQQIYPVVGTLATGVLYLGAPLMTPLVRR